MLLSGKRGLIVGVANKHSIAWAIAQSAAGQGAQLFFNYQNERLKENVEELVAALPGSKAFPCDAGDDAQIDSLMNHVGKEAGKLDFLIHSIAFAPREELTGQFVNTTRKGFATALDVSTYSLVALTRAALVAAARMALDLMRADPGAPAETLELLRRVLRDYDRALARHEQTDGR